jgi:hypothetical protein
MPTRPPPPLQCRAPSTRPSPGAAAPGAPSRGSGTTPRPVARTSDSEHLDYFILFRSKAWVSRNCMVLSTVPVQYGFHSKIMPDKSAIIIVTRNCMLLSTVPVQYEFHSKIMPDKSAIIIVCFGFPEK